MGGTAGSNSPKAMHVVTITVLPHSIGALFQRSAIRMEWLVICHDFASRNKTGVGVAVVRLTMAEQQLKHYDQWIHWNVCQIKRAADKSNNVKVP
jgi:hypothetical protein